MALEKLFPTTIYRSKPTRAMAKQLVERLVRESYAFREIDSPGKKWSKQNYEGGYTSYSSVTDLPFRSSEFARLKKWIDGEVKKYVRALEIELPDGKLEMATCWINIMGKHCYHAYHLHPLSVISGTFYLQTPPGSGAFKIEDPRIQSFMNTPPRTLSAKRDNRRYLDIQPEPGELLLFESFLKHEVTPNRSSQDRISVSFNYDWIR